MPGLGKFSMDLNFNIIFFEGIVFLKKDGQL